MADIFKFKQFEVDQSGCAMKINTDGVLLGAIANKTLPQNILDVGSGTGVIALMLAQRYPEAEIIAVEIDELAANTACRNFEKSTFNHRLTAEHVAIESYHSSIKFDLIVSNPPFFVNDLKNADYRKKIARHTNEQFFDDLIKRVDDLLSDDGFFWFILPVKQAQLLTTNAKIFNLFPVRIIELHSDLSKPSFRQIVCLGKKKSPIEIEQFYIYESEKEYTHAYQELLKDFFLAF